MGVFSDCQAVEGKDDQPQRKRRIQRHKERREVPDKQAITGNITMNHYSFLPALPAKQVKRGGFEAIYEDNVWKVKPNSNDQNPKSVVEFLFLK